MTNPLYEEAKDRVTNDAKLSKFKDIFLDDWPEGDEHYKWVIHAPVSDLLDWAKAIAKDCHYCDDDCRSYGCVERDLRRANHGNRYRVYA